VSINSLKNKKMSKNRIAYQLELVEQLKTFLTTLQERLLEVQNYYDRTLGKLEAEGMYVELLEKQRKEHFAVTKKSIDDLIELIEESDKRYADKIINRLTILLNT
jgi:hypothetical protein